MFVVGEIDVEDEFGEEHDLAAVVVEVLCYVCDNLHYGERIPLGNDRIEEAIGRDFFYDLDDLIEPVAELS